jgi:drug/metabolite transporter (DMT)-like permease
MLNALYVMLGAGLWATDALFRHPMIQQISPLTIVFLEHAFVVVMSGIWMLAFHRRDWKLNSGQFVGAFLIGALGSAVASILFTSSFHFVNPTVSILLQKVQPILVIVLSVAFLGERVSPSFVLWAALALGAAFYMSFPGGLDDITLSGANRSGVLLALAAAVFWAISTVIGKITLKTAQSTVLSFWRFFFGLLTCVIFVSQNLQSRIEIPFLYQEPKVLNSIFFMALIPGFVAVSLYYRGLAKVPASVATILELSFPFAAMWVNAHYLDLHLTDVQLGAALTLLVAMVGVGRSQKQKVSRQG